MIDHPAIYNSRYDPNRKGEWRVPSDSASRVLICSSCKGIHRLPGNSNKGKKGIAPYFCPRCGAEMKNGGERLSGYARA